MRAGRRALEAGGVIFIDEKVLRSAAAQAATKTRLSTWRGHNRAPSGADYLTRRSNLHSCCITSSMR